MGKRSRKQLKITPEMSAEDSFRFKFMKDNVGGSRKSHCMWYKQTKSSVCPKSDRRLDHQYIKSYNTHLELLNSTFLQQDSLFKLEFVEGKGLCVLARSDLSVAYDDRVNAMLSAKYQDPIEGVEWTLGTVYAPIRDKGGRPSKKSVDNNKRRSERLINIKKMNTHINMAVLAKNLVGPFNFLNHACENCAQFNWEMDTDGQKVHCTVKKHKHIKKGEEIFISYLVDNVQDSDEKLAFPCGKCNL